MITVTDKFLDGLREVIQGPKRAYQIEVKRRAPKQGESNIYQYFDVVVTDHGTGRNIKTETLKAKPEDKISDLEAFVHITKHSASTDFK